VPTTIPVRVKSPPPVAFAMPKSVTFTGPSRGTSTLAGFTSRWTMPFRCATSSAADTWRAMFTEVSTSSAPLRSSIWRRLSPSTSSITMNARSSSSPVS
jgi:hypothetical protein